MKEKYIEDLKEIRDIMNRSTRFVSLSGLSGISVGIVALIGAYLVHFRVIQHSDYLILNSVSVSAEHLTSLLIIAAGTMIMSIGLVIFLTKKEIRRQNQKIWDSSTRRILLNLAIPLFTGGILCLMLIAKGFVGIILPLTLIFYGLALVNVSKYTLDEMRSLGLLEIVG
jgi:hypothetical protein